MRQEYFIEYPQHVFDLPDLPVRDVRPFPQVSQKCFYVLSGPIFQRFFSQNIFTRFRPPDIEGRTVWSYPVLLREPPVGFPKTIPSAGILGNHDIPPKSVLSSAGYAANTLLIMGGIIVSQYKLSV